MIGHFPDPAARAGDECNRVRAIRRWMTRSCIDPHPVVPTCAIPNEAVRVAARIAHDSGWSARRAVLVSEAVPVREKRVRGAEVLFTPVDEDSVGRRIRGGRGGMSRSSGFGRRNPPQLANDVFGTCRTLQMEHRSRCSSIGMSSDRFRDPTKSRQSLVWGVSLQSETSQDQPDTSKVFESDDSARRTNRQCWARCRSVQAGRGCDVVLRAAQRAGDEHDSNGEKHMRLGSADGESWRPRSETCALCAVCTYRPLYGGRA